jgi:1,4-alpha-glucan branching enzyme
LVKTAPAKGIAVILDVVYNHFGPSDLDLWQFDGWSENDKGGVYFYNDDRSSTPWGETRPDYGRGEVRQFIFDNAMMWIEEFHMDGLRYDMTLYMRTIDGCETRTIPEGWSLAQWINREIHARYPKRITIAEDLRSNPAVTQPDFLGGGDFSTQWDEGFVHPIRNVVAQVEDQHRSMQAVCDAVTHRYNNDAFERVVYSESHDEVANGKQRLVSEIDQETPDSFHARKRSMLAAAMVFTSPGIPMIFQGQEFLRSRWFDDTNPIDWEKASENEEVVRFYRQLIRLRTNAEGVSKGLTGQHVDFRHINDVDKVIAFHRWHEHGPGDDCFVVANFSHRRFENYRFGLPSAGNWNLMIDSGSNEFGDDFSSTNPGTIESVAEAPMDGYAHSAKLALSPYSVVILSRSAKQ